MTVRKSVVLVVATLVASALAVTRANALPSFAAQTGEPCTTCHVGAFGPQLTPFGRAFKIGGYTQTGGEGLASQIPFSAMVQGSFTHTNESQPGAAAPHFGDNNNFAVDQVSLFLAGRLSDYAGAFVQGTYSGISRAFHLDNTDIRLTTPLSLSDSELRIGVSVNNAPTVQDPYNSTPVWMFPFFSSSLAPTPAAQPLLDGGLAGNSLGVTGYLWYDHQLYIEAGGYGSYSPNLLSTTGNALGPGATANIAPYVRAAWQWAWNQQSAYIGGLLLSANLNPAISATMANSSQGQNQFTDYGFDTGYQYLGDGTHTITGNALFIHEHQHLQASFNAGASSQVNSDAAECHLLLPEHLWPDAGLAVHLGPAESAAVRAGAGDRQRQWQTRQQRVHRRSRLGSVRQGGLLGVAVRQSEDRPTICRLHTVQWGNQQLRRLRPQRQRQQHSVPLCLDSVLTGGKDCTQPHRHRPQDQKSNIGPGGKWRRRFPVPQRRATVQCQCGERHINQEGRYAGDQQ
jgi:hypothetical protein